MTTQTQPKPNSEPKSDVYISLYDRAVFAAQEARVATLRNEKLCRDKHIEDAQQAFRNYIERWLKIKAPTYLDVAVRPDNIRYPTVTITAEIEGVMLRGNTANGSYLGAVNPVKSCPDCGLLIFGGALQTLGLVGLGEFLLDPIPRHQCPPPSPEDDERDAMSQEESDDPEDTAITPAECSLSSSPVSANL